MTHGPMADFVPMTAVDNPLVALASRLGYAIFIDARPVPPGTRSPRYRGDLPEPHEVRYYANDLVTLLTSMIQHHSFLYATLAITS